MGSTLWKSTSLTAPRWPGSLYTSFLNYEKISKRKKGSRQIVGRIFIVHTLWPNKYFFLIKIFFPTINI
jgi:hypothetical protein